jgi:hypothetical protein
MITFEQYANHDCHHTAEDSCQTCIEWGFQVNDLYVMQKNLMEASHGMVYTSLKLHDNMFSADHRTNMIAKNGYTEAMNIMVTPEGELEYV